MKSDPAAVNLRDRIAGARTVDAGKGIGAQVGRTVGKRDSSAGRTDGKVPFVAGHVPVELVVIFEKAQRVGNRVFNNDGSRNIPGVGNIDFEFAIVPLAGALVF